jgi:hypothetical protein
MWYGASSICEVNKNYYIAVLELSHYLKLTRNYVLYIHPENMYILYINYDTIICNATLSWHRFLV